MNVRVSLDRRFARLLMRCSTNTSFDELWVGVLDDQEAMVILEKIVESLEFIKVHDPLRYRRIVHDLQGIWAVRVFSGCGMLRFSTGVCEIDPAFVLRSDSDAIASVIVHEATHARLKRFGYKEAARARIEQVCRRRELAFARKHPGGDAIIRRFSLDQPIPSDIYSDQAFDLRQRQSAVRVARDVGIPEWIIRSLLWARDHRSSFWTRGAIK